LEFEPTLDDKHRLFAAYRKFRDSKPNSLSPADNTYLSNAYAKFISPSIDAGESFLLTPLFEYEAGTIDACIATVLAPIGKALEEGKSLPDIGFFSTDPRIDKAFNEALKKLKTEAQNRQSPVSRQSAVPLMPESSALAPTDIRIPSSSKTEKLKVQVGISDPQWKPREKTLLLLTSSSKDCVRPEEVSIGIELSQTLESKEFSAAKKKSGFFSEPDESPWGCANRYMAPVEEVTVEESTWLFNSAKLDDSKASEIQLAYTRVCKDAVKNGIDKLVLTPCFKQVSKTLLSSDKPYRDAVGVMVETLAGLSSLYPQLELTMVARSEAEMELMQKAMENQRLAAS
jgi:hypothetical protein